MKNDYTDLESKLIKNKVNSSDKKYRVDQGSNLWYSAPYMTGADTVEQLPHAKISVK